MEEPNQPRCRRYGVVLTANEVVAIYRCKVQLSFPDTFKSSLLDERYRTKGRSSHVAKRFGVSAKTIRDIWNKRTWTNVTADLWSNGSPQVSS